MWNTLWFVFNCDAAQVFGIERFQLPGERQSPPQIKYYMWDATQFYYASELSQHLNLNSFIVDVELIYLHKLMCIFVLSWTTFHSLITSLTSEILGCGAAARGIWFPAHWRWGDEKQTELRTGISLLLSLLSYLSSLISPLLSLLSYLSSLLSYLIVSYIINTALYLSSFLFSNQNTTRPRHDFWSNHSSSYYISSYISSYLSLLLLSFSPSPLLFLLYRPQNIE